MGRLLCCSQSYEVCFCRNFGCRYNRSAELKNIKADNAKIDSMEVNFPADDAVFH